MFTIRSLPSPILFDILLAVASRDPKAVCQTLPLVCRYWLHTSKLHSFQRSLAKSCLSRLRVNFHPSSSLVCELDDNNAEEKVTKIPSFDVIRLAAAAERLSHLLRPMPSSPTQTPSRVGWVSADITLNICCVVEVQESSPVCGLLWYKFNAHRPDLDERHVLLHSVSVPTARTIGQCPGRSDCYPTVPSNAPCTLSQLLCKLSVCPECHRLMSPYNGARICLACYDILTFQEGMN